MVTEWAFVTPIILIVLSWIYNEKFIFIFISDHKFSDQKDKNDHVTTSQSGKRYNYCLRSIVCLIWTILQTWLAAAVGWLFDRMSNSANWTNTRTAKRSKKRKMLKLANYRVYRRQNHKRKSIIISNWPNEQCSLNIQLSFRWAPRVSPSSWTRVCEIDS